ncbi:MAG: tryptophan synthase subunit alpha [Proteobacteria bacterium]|nr:tryptophan synthase subunit alpha [Pseudomonadota bacterium]MBU1582892.1 tryptophan synthase subunit alpha [Pseudomonadota bacterium]MBU2454657.1 tryptophan synthase subunit alpha [Pseudomonadota bacterium]MBU2627396.1 tryptophan synthase subunit alpha [Pseudomonadota bacterium]
MLESYIKEQRKKKDILLMTHIVMGYPSFEESYEIVRQMVAAGVDLMELQIPFSEPMADGPVILKANQVALEKGSTVKKCFDFAQQVSKEFPIPFLFMSYANILFKYGIKKFSDHMAKINLKGAIVPDLPPEEGADYIKAMKKNNLSPIYIFSPETSDKRLEYLSCFASGFVYCMARKGVTGKQTAFSDDLSLYLSRCRSATHLPLAVGFGVKDKADIAYLKGKADIAVIGSQTIRIVEEKGAAATGDFIQRLF